MRGFLGGLFSSGSTEGKSKATATAERSAPRREEPTERSGQELVFLDPYNEPPLPAPTDIIIATLGIDPEASASPDAAAILELVAKGPDEMIRRLPSAAQTSLALCDDPNLTRGQLAEKLSEDPALVQSLLRCANSAAYGAGKAPVIGISQAIDRIGMAGTRSLIFSNAIDGVLSRPGGEFDAMASEVWQHMVRTAPLARSLAPLLSVDADEAFSIALLHDVGKLVIFDRISVLRAKLRRDVKLTPGFTKSLLMDLHETLGAMAAEAWNMGPRAARAIGSHHRKSGDGMPNPLAEVVYLAEAIDHAMHRNYKFDMRGVLFDGKVKIDQERLATLLDRMDVTVR
jgi:putative nucleotidyltransferase with HDIG domain